MYYLGIDGGGTKTEAVLCDNTGHILNRRTTVGSNPNDLVIELSGKVICRLVSDVLGDIPPENVSAVFGIAGCYDSNNNADLFAYITDRYKFYSFKLCPDVWNVFFSELTDADICMLICGTGSVAFARVNGKYYRAGGWGHLIDDAGSGYDIGRKALCAVLRETDGRGEHTLLTELVRSKLHKPPEKCIHELYKGGKKEIASFAPLVFSGLNKRDKVCEKILLDAAHELSLLITAACKNIESDTKRVILCGGILKGNKAFAEMLRSQLDETYQLELSSAPPVFGSYAESLRQTGVIPNDKIKETFLENYNK